MGYRTTRYASGARAWGECQRSGKRVLLKELVRDGYNYQLMVAPEWWEPFHPQEIVIPVDDAVALEHPAPDLDKGQPNVDGTATSLASVIGGTTFGS